MSKKYVSLSLALIAGLAFAGAAQAQWEEVYGHKDQKDEGHRRVAPVVNCPGRGYIAIGTRDLGGFQQVYVVRNDNGGNLIWEHGYDVIADNRPDEGFALVELKDGSGFVTTGTSNSGAQSFIHVMKIDCNGRPRFTMIYGQPSVTAPYRLVGHDIREAFSGDGVTTNAGDLLVAGWLDDQFGNTDAVLLRLRANGTLIWHRRYDNGVGERFFGLTETQPTFAATGDIAAVGEYQTVLGTQALVARVDGLTGGLGGPDQCIGAIGDAGEENLQSVIEVRNAPDKGLLVMAGLSTSPGLNQDVFVLQTKPNPCGALNRVTIGNETGDPYNEYATDIIEVLEPVDPSLGVPVGSYALTGMAETKLSIGDAFLLFLKPTSFGVLGARRYGDHKSFLDFGTSLAQNPSFGAQPPGFILAGTTLTDWDGSADPLDLYLIQPTDAAKTGCEKEWFPDDLHWDWEVRELHTQIDKVVKEAAVQTKTFRDDTAVRVCN